MAALVAGGLPVHAQWNMYQNYSSSFFVPFTGSNAADSFRLVDLTLHLGDSTKKTGFTMDTGSTGIAAGTNYFQPRLTGPDRDIAMGGGQIGSSARATPND